MQQPPFYMLEVQFKMLHTDNHVRQIGSKMKSATAMCIYSLVKDLDQLMQASWKLAPQINGEIPDHYHSIFNKQSSR